MIVQGKVHSVETYPSGTAVLQDYSAGATALAIGVSLDLQEAGGKVTILGTQYDYMLDLNTDIITLLSPLAAAIEDGEPVLVYPPSEEKRAYVISDDEEDSIIAVVPHFLAGEFEVGIREEDGRESVTAEEIRGVWQVQNIIALEPQSAVQINYAVTTADEALAAAEAAGEADTTTPNPPTAFTSSATLYLDNGGSSRCVVTVSWTPPTTNTDASPIDDIQDYEFQWKYSTDGAGAYRSEIATAPTTSVSELDAGKTMNVQVRARDASGHVSTWLVGTNIVLPADTTAPSVPSTPVATVDKGVVSVSWDGKNNAAGAMETDFSHINVYRSATAGFTPSAATLFDRMSGPGLVLVSGQPYNVPWYYKFTSVDRTGNTSLASGQATATTVPLVSGDLGTGVAGNRITVSATAPTSPTPVDGDQWIDTANGNVIKIREGGAWVNRQDAAIATAQNTATTAQNTATGKNKVTYSASTPGTTANTAGDIWYQQSGNQIIGQWVGAGGTSWTSVTLRNEVLATLDAAKITTGTLDANRIAANSLSIGQVNGLQPALNAKSTTFAQAAIPTSVAAGDLWIDTDDNNKTYRAFAAGVNTIGASAWVLYSTPAPTTFAQTSIPVSLNIGDLWFDTDDNNKQYRAASVGADAIAAGEWVLVEGTDMTTFAQTSIPTATKAGDLWIDTDDGNKMYRAFAAGVTTIAANGWVAVPLAATRTFAQTSIPVAVNAGDIWFDTDDGNKEYRAFAAGVSTIASNGWVWYQDAAIPALAARGNNLVTNGDGILKNNTNFTTMVYHGEDAPTGTSGSFYASSGAQASWFSDAFISFDPFLQYRFEFKCRQTVAAQVAKMYGMIAPFDSDNNSIGPQHYMYIANTTTTLAQPLNTNDTTITLTSSANWYGSAGKPAGAAPHLRNYIFWDYVDGAGKAWPVGTYSRNIGSTAGVWADGGIVGNVITLSAPYTGPPKAAGTAISNATAGGAYIYMPSATNVTVPETWTDYGDTFRYGVFPLASHAVASTGGATWTSGVPMATAKIKIGWLLNYPPVSGLHAIAGVKFSDVGAVANTVNGWTYTGTTNINGGVIQTDTILAAQIAAGAVTASELAAGAVVAGKIAAGTITANDIATNAITADRMATGTITAASGVIGSLDASKIITGKLSASFIDTGTLAAGLTMTGFLLAGDPGGARVVIDKDGLRQYSSAGNIIVNLPNDTAVPAQFEGSGTFGSLTSKDNLSIQGVANEIARGSVLAASSGTGSPTTIPSVAVGYQTFNPSKWTEGSLYVPTGAYCDIDDSDEILTGMTFFGYGQFQGRAGKWWVGAEYTDNTGSKRSKYGNIGSSVAIAVGGQERIVCQCVYMTGEGAAPTGKIVSVDPSTMTSTGSVAPVEKANLNSTMDNYVFQIKLGRVIGIGAANYSDRIAMALMNWNATVYQEGMITLRQYTVTDGGASGFTMVGSTHYVIASPFMADEGLQGVTHGSSLDMGFPGTDQYIWLVHGTFKTYAYAAPAMTRLPDFDFNHPSGSARVMAWGHIVNNTFTGFRCTLWSDKTPIVKLTNNHWAAGVSNKWWVSTTNYDADAGGTGQHESMQGPRASISMPRRAGITVTVPEYPARPFPTTQDDPLAARIYLARGATDPGRTYMERVGELNSPNRTLTIGDFTFPAGAAAVPPPAASNFPASSPGKIQSSDGSVWVLGGDGAFTLGAIAHDTVAGTTVTNGKTFILGDVADSVSHHYRIRKKATSGANYYELRQYLYDGGAYSGWAQVLLENGVEASRIQMNNAGDFQMDEGSEAYYRTNGGWIALTPVSPWVAYGSGYRAPAYRKDVTGMVYLRGLVKSGAVGSTIFTLPSGYRPLEHELFTVNISHTSETGTGRLQINSSGTIVLSQISPTTATTGHVSLSGAMFYADGS